MLNLWLYDTVELSLGIKLGVGLLSSDQWSLDPLGYGHVSNLRHVSASQRVQCSLAMDIVVNCVLSIACCQKGRNIYCFVSKVCTMESSWKWDFTFLLFLQTQCHIHWALIPWPRISPKLVRGVWEEEVLFESWLNNMYNPFKNISLILFTICLDPSSRFQLFFFLFFFFFHVFSTFWDNYHSSRTVTALFIIPIIILFPKKY